MTIWHPSPQGLLFDLVCQSINHHCKQEGAQGRSLMQSHSHLKCLSYSYCSNHCCHTALIYISCTTITSALYLCSCYSSGLYPKSNKSNKGLTFWMESTAYNSCQTQTLNINVICTIHWNPSADIFNGHLRSLSFVLWDIKGNSTIQPLCIRKRKSSPNDDNSLLLSREQ